MKRMAKAINNLLFTVLISIALSSCGLDTSNNNQIIIEESTPEISNTIDVDEPEVQDNDTPILDEDGSEVPDDSMPFSLGQLIVDSRLILTELGGLTQVYEEVVEGSGSIIGKYFGTENYSPFLELDRRQVKFNPGQTYEVTFDYLILETPDKGFETLFYSPIAGDNNDWLPSIEIIGNMGESGSIKLTNTLKDYNDYLLRWNVIGTGAISIDNIRIENKSTGEEILFENIENIESVFAASGSDRFYPQIIEMPNTSKINLTWLGNGFTRVEGEAGAIPGEFKIFVASPNTFSGSFLTANADGSFSTEIVAPPSSWVIIKYDPTNEWLFPISEGDDDDVIESVPAQHAPGIWMRVPYEMPSSDGTPFFLSFTIATNFLDVTLSGNMTGQFNPGGFVKLHGIGTAYSADEKVDELLRTNVDLGVYLFPLFNEAGNARLQENQFFSNVLTPTGLPIEQLLCCGLEHNREDFILRNFQKNDDGTISFPFDVTLDIPPNLPSGNYSVWIDAYSLELVGGELIEQRTTRSFHTNFPIHFPPFEIGTASQPRMIWTLLTDVLSADGSRGTVAAEDRGNFDIASRMVTQSDKFIIPRISKMTGDPIPYRLEPYLPMVSQGDRTLPSIPNIDFLLPSGSLTVRITRPDGEIIVLGPAPFTSLHSRTPTASSGAGLDDGGGNLANVLQLSTSSGLFDYEFPLYGKYQIEMTGFVEDVYGNYYSGGGNYTIYVAEPLDIEPATLPMTPFEVGDAMNFGLTVIPGVPANVDVSLTLLENSDSNNKIEYHVEGEANRFGIFTPNLDDPPFYLTGSGEFIVDMTASYWDQNDVLWMGTLRWGQVVETPGSPIIAHGRRGRDINEDGEPIEEVNLWFTSPKFISISHIHIPYASGDILWQNNGDSAKVKITIQDTEGIIEDLMRIQGPPVYMDNFNKLINKKILLGELPLNSFTTTGFGPALYPEDVNINSYFYGSVQRPGERVREIITENTMDAGGTSYWRFDEIYALQHGVGAEGDLPNDFKFTFGGAVYRNEDMDINLYGIYSSLWVMISDEDPLGSRVFPPFQGLNGGPSGGPIMILRGEEIDSFVVPLAIKPGAILEVGDTFSFSAQLAPTLGGKLDLEITGPNGYSQSISGRANSIGYYYDPSKDFVIDLPGKYHVDVTATFDIPTSAGQMVEPYPTGTVLGANDGGFDFYVVNSGNEKLMTGNPTWGVVRGLKVPFTIGLLQGIESTNSFYTITMPGFILETGDIEFEDGWAMLEYDAEVLRVVFPNIDLIGLSRGRRGLADTVTITVFVEGSDNKFYARQFHLQGSEQYSNP